jgi:membrane protease subunit HflC
MKQPLTPLALTAAILLVSAYSAIFSVNQTEQAILIQLGEPVGSLLEPGLHIKIPYIQRVLRFDRQLLDHGAQQIALLTADQQNLLISYYAKWRVTDLLLFFQRVGDRKAALQRLDDVIDAELRAAFACQRLAAILASGRSIVTQPALQRGQAASKEFGIALADLQITDIRLPPANLAASWERQRADLAAMSQAHRSAGQEKSIQRMAEADRQRTAIIAEARRSAQILRGEAEAEATRIYTEAYAQDPEFFNFCRTLDASRKALNETSVLILSPDYEFLRFLKDSGLDREPTR